MNHSQRVRQSYAMNSRLGDWPRTRLLLRCERCQDKRVILVALLRRAYGDEQRLGEIVTRLRCHVPRCRGRPDYVRIEEVHDPQSSGHAHAVLLIGPGAYG